MKGELHTPVLRTRVWLQRILLQVDNCNQLTTLDSILTFVTEVWLQTYFINMYDYCAWNTIISGAQK